MSRNKLMILVVGLLIACLVTCIILFTYGGIGI
jgi:hypothetical protein